jgi:hypothetical protein
MDDLGCCWPNPISLGAPCCSKPLTVWTAASLQMSLFWDVAPCSLRETDGRFRGEDGSVMGCYAVWSRTRMFLLPLSSGPSSPWWRASERSVNFYETTRRYDPDDSQLHTRRQENMKCRGFRGVYRMCRRNLMALTMESVSTSDTLANIYQTIRRNILEGSHVHAGRREGLNWILQNCPDSWVLRIC